MPLSLIHILRSLNAPQFLCGEALTPVSVWWRQTQISEGFVKSHTPTTHAQGEHQTCPACWTAFASHGSVAPQPGKVKEVRRGVTVYNNGKNLVNLSFNEMSGLNQFSEEEEEAIRLAGEHLLAFIGRRKEES